MKIDLYILILALIVINASTQAQQLDVEGAAHIRGNLSLGQQFDASSVCIGIGAGSEPMTSTSKSNTMIGHHAGERMTTGRDNTLIGKSAGASNRAGERNTIMGTYAGFLNQGGYNTFVGGYAGYLNTTGVKNSFFGELAGNRNSTGDFNVYLGANAGQEASTGYKNVFVGVGAGQRATEGNENVVVGESAGMMLSDGSRNTLIGTRADIAYVQVTNATAIGYQAVVTVSDAVRIGNKDVGAISGQVPFTSSSDRRLKEGIKPIDLGLDFINDLHPEQYHRRTNRNDDLEMGLIAQELNQTLDNHQANNLGIIQADHEGMLMIRYNDLIPTLIKSIQELSQRQRKLEQEIHIFRKGGRPIGSD